MAVPATIAVAPASSTCQVLLGFSPSHHVTSSDTTVMFEFECEGVIEQAPYRGRIAIALEVRNEKVSGFREYFGDVDW